jgi:hypothetical protein
MASRADRPFRDDDRPPREPRAEQGPPQNGWRPEEEEDRPREMRRPYGPPRQFEGDDDERMEGRRRRPQNGQRRPDPMEIGHALTDTFASAVERGATLLGNNIRAFQDETARFVTQRVERDMEAMEEMSRSRNLMELFSVHQRWLTNLTTDYSRGMMRLSRLTGSVAEETMESGRRAADNARRMADM